MNYVIRVGTKETTAVPVEPNAGEHATLYAIDAGTADQRLDAYGKRNVVARRIGNQYELAAHGHRVRLPAPTSLRPSVESKP